MSTQRVVSAATIDQSPAGSPHLDKVWNFRDAGCLKTAGGHILKTGVLFRSGELSRMTAGDAATLQGLGIRLICDLRGPEESRARQPRKLPEGVARSVNIPLGEQATAGASRKQFFGFLFRKDGDERFLEFSRTYYRHIVFEQAPRIGRAIALLATEGNLPAVFHCRAGKDRTGLLVAVVQLLVGVPYADVRAEYLRTNDATSLPWPGRFGRSGY